jgi:hypothetical protein
LNIINAIEKGELKMDTVDYIVCHVDSVMDTLKLRGLLKKKMPDKKKGTHLFRLRICLYREICHSDVVQIELAVLEKNPWFAMYRFGVVFRRKYPGTSIFLDILKPGQNFKFKS